MEQIDAYRWRIPVSCQPGMRVPGLIFSSEKLLSDVALDQSLQQVANVAHLPGIVKASMAMPDIHWGYGFPIGGVAAMDPDTGVISPGGVGYDINCLSGETPVMHRFGYTRPLAELVNAGSLDMVSCYRLKGNIREGTQIVAGIRKPPTNSVLEIVTVTGRRIRATSDHPFLTPGGMRPLNHIHPGERMAVDPFEGVPYEAPTDGILIDESQIRAFLHSRGRTAGNAVEQVLRYLREKHLVPLRRNASALPVLIKVLGMVFGDGTLCFSSSTGKGTAACFGKPEDLQDIAEDLRPWWTPSRVYHRQRTHRIETEYGERCFEATNSEVRVRSTSFAVLLALLGCPIGNKARQNYEMPPWLLTAPRWHQRLFLAAYFGAELQAPRPYAKRPRNFPCPLLTLQKHERFSASGRRFLMQLSSMARPFGVETVGINERRERIRRRHGVSVRLRLMFSSRPESLERLYTRIGFEYHRCKRAEAAVVAAYQRYKRTRWSERNRVRDDIIRLRAGTGKGAKGILQLLGSEAGRVNVRFIERTLYGRGERTLRVGSTFCSYPEFKKDAIQGLESSGLVWEEVASLVPIHDVARVYDITVEHADHNFIANGFVVHNCGVRLVRTDLTATEVQPVLRRLTAALFHRVPCGVGMRGDIQVRGKEEERVMARGASWAVAQGYGTPDDLDHTESLGCLEGADPSKVSDRARQRGCDQLGTLGSGNHFLEVQMVERIDDARAADALGLFEGQVTVMIHSGSRGFGYQICEDYLDVASSAMSRYGIAVPDRQLACAPLTSEEGLAYLGAMRCAANYAWANRQCLMHLARTTFERVFGRRWDALGMRLVYDVAHNIAKFERHRVDGQERTLCVHRKGATRAFPPDHPETPEAYRTVGQPVIIPGDMGRHSYVLVGAPSAMEESFGSCCHGAGRVMSRSEAVRRSAGRSIEQELAEQGIIVMGRGRKGIAEEQPAAYKDVNDVVDVVHGAGLARRVARLRPLGVIKG